MTDNVIDMARDRVVRRLKEIADQPIHRPQGALLREDAAALLAERDENDLLRKQVARLNARNASLMDRVSACKCGSHVRDIDTSRTDAKPYALMEAAAVERLLERSVL